MAKDEQQLEQQIYRHAWLTTVLVAANFAVVAVFVIVAVMGYQWLNDPQAIVDSGEEYIRREYPEMKKNFTNEVKKSAPQIAERVSQRAIAQAPELRREAETFLEHQMQKGIARVTDLSAEQLREFLKNNHDRIEQRLERLQEAPAKVEAFAQELEADLEQQFETDLQQDLDYLLGAHRQLNDRLAKLRDGAGLTPDELLERRIVRLLRTLSQRELKKLAEDSRASPAKPLPGTP